MWTSKAWAGKTAPAVAWATPSASGIEGRMDYPPHPWDNGYFHLLFTYDWALQKPRRCLAVATR